MLYIFVFNIVKKLKGGEKQVIKKTKLLIIALLLLFVSIGAVCAQENVTVSMMLLMLKLPS